MPPLAFRVPVHVRTPESDSPVQVRVVQVKVPVSVSPVHVMFCRLVVPWTVRFWVTWLVEITVPKEPVPPTERLPETVRAPVSVSPAVVSEVVVMLVKLPVPPVNVPAMDRLLTEVLPCLLYTSDAADE